MVGMLVIFVLLERNKVAEMAFAATEGPMDIEMLGERAKCWIHAAIFYQASLYGQSGYESLVNPLLLAI